MSIIGLILDEMLSDEDNTEKQSQILKDVYTQGTPEQREALDRAFIALCGWSLATCIENDEGAPEHVTE